MHVKKIEISFFFFLNYFNSTGNFEQIFHALYLKNKKTFNVFNSCSSWLTTEFFYMHFENTCILILKIKRRGIFWKLSTYRFFGYFLNISHAKINWKKRNFWFNFGLLVLMRIFLMAVISSILGIFGTEFSRHIFKALFFKQNLFEKKYIYIHIRNLNGWIFSLCCTK
jgi:hypothetical protein